MQATHFRLLAHCIALSTLIFASCAGSDEAVGGKNSHPETAGTGNEAGEPAGGTPAGGMPSAGGTGGSSAIAGGRSGAGGSGGSTTAGGEGGVPADDPERLIICARLSKATELSVNHEHRFEDLMKVDCDVKWVSRLYVDARKRDDYLNELLVWNLRFWGCQEPPVDDFSPVYGTPALSQGDVNRIIEHYLTAADEVLALSAREEAQMRAALELLAQPLVVSASEEPSQSACSTGAGGEGGAGGGAGGASGGASGQASGGEGGSSGDGGTTGATGGSPGTEAGAAGQLGSGGAP